MTKRVHAAPPHSFLGELLTLLLSTLTIPCPSFPFLAL